MPNLYKWTIGTGFLIFILNLVNLSINVDITPSLLRAEILTGISSVLIILIGILTQKSNSKKQLRLIKQEKQSFWISEDINEDIRNELAWGSQLFLTATPACSLLVYWRGKTIMRRGLQGTGEFEPASISNKAMSAKKITSLPNTKFYPGSYEFDPLTKDLPSLLIAPISINGLIILGGWNESCFTISDQRWLEGWSMKISNLLETSNQ